MGKILGIDFGTKNIGLALSDETQMVAERFANVSATKNRIPEKQVAQEVTDHDIDVIVIGMPLGLDGKPTKISKAAREFADRLGAIMEVDVKEWNETYSSQQAEQNIKDDVKIHMEAARIILQGYLDFLNSGI